jgi:hypothetical protein
MDFARQDNCLDQMVPSDLRVLVGERDALHARLNGYLGGAATERDTLRKAYDLSNATNSRLVAHVERLRGVAIDLVYDAFPKKIADEILAETPAQSVAHIEAAVLRRVADRYEAVLMLDAADDLRGEADDIEQAAKS